MAEKNTKLILSNDRDVKTSEITVNDRAATRKAIINYLEKFLPVISKNKFLETSSIFFLVSCEFLFLAILVPFYHTNGM